MRYHVFTCLVLAVFLAFFSSNALAEGRVAFVDVAEIMERMPEAAAIREEIQDEFGRQERALRESHEELMSLQERYERDSAVMSDADRQELEQEIIQRKQTLQQEQRQLQQRLNQRSEREMRRLQQMIGEAVEAVARAGDYDMVVYDGVVYASERVDITDAVLQRLMDD
jgi:outer membrane protein